MRIITPQFDVNFYEGSNGIMHTNISESTLQAITSLLFHFSPRVYTKRCPKSAMGPHVSHVHTQIFRRVVSMKGSFSLILGNSSNEVPLCIFHQAQTFISKMIFFFQIASRFHSQFDHPNKSLQTGKHNRIKVQPQYCSELIWSPLAEK